MEALLPLHPRFVHYPIALSLVGIAILALGIWRGRPGWIAYGRLSLLLGWAGALVAALTGLVDQAGAPDTPAVTGAINQHITAGVALLIALGLALYWPLRDRKLPDKRWHRWAYLGLLAVVAGLVLLEGWLGGRLVYTLGVGVRR